MYRLTLCIVIYFLINVTDGRESIEIYTSEDGNRDVNTTEGIIRGHVVNEENYEYMAFIGVAYAAPPVGNMRFRVSQYVIYICNMKGMDRVMKTAMLGVTLRDLKCNGFEIGTKLRYHSCRVEEKVYMSNVSHIARKNERRWTRRILTWRPRADTKGRGRLP